VLRQKGHSGHIAARDKSLTSGIVTGFGDNAINEFVAIASHV
jgi:hypothetical protein